MNSVVLFFDNAHDVAVGTDGVDFTGETNSFNANDAFVAKADSNGTVLWARDWAALARDGVPGLTSAFGMDTTTDGGVVITGNASDIGTLNNTILVKYNSAGTLVAGFVHAPPYEFAGVSNSSRNADATSTDAISTAPVPAGTVNTDPGGIVRRQISSESYAGDREAFFLRLQR